MTTIEKTFLVLPSLQTPSQQPVDISLLIWGHATALHRHLIEWCCAPYTVGKYQHKPHITLTWTSVTLSWRFLLDRTPLSSQANLCGVAPTLTTNILTVFFNTCSDLIPVPSDFWSKIKNLSDDCSMNTVSGLCIPCSTILIKVTRYCKVSGLFAEVYKVVKYFGSKCNQVDTFKYTHLGFKHDNCHCNIVNLKI